MGWALEEGAQERNNSLHGEASQEGRDMICFCINNNRGSRTHILSIITPSVFLVSPFRFPLSISFSFGKVCILSPKQASYYMYWRSHYSCVPVSFVRTICWDILLFHDDQGVPTVGRCIQRGVAGW